MSAQATLTGFGRTLPILTIVVIANFVYRGLEYALIYGASGMPEMGFTALPWPL